MPVVKSTPWRWIWIVGVLVGLLLAAVVYFGFVRTGAEIKKIRVEHYQEPAMGAFPCLCMLVDDGSGMERLYTGIEGFQYAWGTSYELTVKVEKVSPRTDVPSIRYTLVSIDKETRVPEGTRFGIQVFDPEFIQDQSILRQRRFEYASDAVRQEFEKRQAELASTGVGFRAEFSHPKDPDKPLVLEAVSGGK